MIRTRSESVFKNLLRYTAAAISSLFVFAIALGILETFNPTEIEVTFNDTDIKTAQNIDWSEFGNEMISMDYSDPDKLEQQLENLEQKIDSLSSVKSVQNINYPDEFNSLLSAFSFALSKNDSIALDTLRPEIAKVLASPEMHLLRQEISELSEQKDELMDENEALVEQIENPSLYIATKRTLRMMGLSLGWIGLYFITTIAFFKGQTIGKRILRIRVVRLNNKPIGLFFAFERLGGYAAGFATGFLGFFQVYWDANRQAIHDKIAGTVVIDLRESKKKETEHLRKEVLDNENLLSHF